MGRAFMRYWYNSVLTLEKAVPLWYNKNISARNAKGANMNLSVLKTDRLILRKFTEEDMDALFGFCRMKKPIHFCRGILPKVLKIPEFFTKKNTHSRSHTPTQSA